MNQSRRGKRHSNIIRHIDAIWVMLFKQRLNGARSAPNAAASRGSRAQGGILMRPRNAAAVPAVAIAGIVMLCIVHGVGVPAAALASEPIGAGAMPAEISNEQFCEPVPDAESASPAKRVAAASKVSKGKRKKGNLARYAHLEKHVWLLALTKGGISVYKSASAKSGKLVWKMRRHSCLVVATEKISQTRNYSWLKVKLTKGKTGYIRVSDVGFKKLDTKTFGLDLSKKENRVRAKICRFGLPFIGTPWNGNKESVRSGINCYRFVYQALAKNHVKVKGKSVKGELASGKKTTRKKLKPGDLVFYHNGNPKKPSHVAIYLGNDLIINASGHYGWTYPNGGIRISHIDYRETPAYRFRSVA